MTLLTINILRYNIFPGEPAHSMYSIYNMETKRRLNEDMELHFLEVPKFQKKPVSEMTSVERWLAYFSNKLDPKEMEELAMNETAIQTALDAATIFMQDKKERLNYLNREMAIFDYESDKDAWISEGITEGHTKTVINTLNRYTRRNIPISADVIADIAEDNEMTIDNVRNIAKENGIAVSC